MTPVDDLAAWLTQIWDEQEALANTAAKVNGSAVWLAADDTDGVFTQTDHIPYPVASGADGFMVNGTRHFIAANDPMSVLARIAADRQILALHSEEPHPLLSRGRGRRYPSDDLSPVCGECSSDDDPYIGQVAYPCETVRLLAQPYADCPGFRDEWRVTA